MKNFYIINLENFFLLKKDFFNKNTLGFICVVSMFVLLINLYNNLHLNYTFNYYILFNLGFLLYTFIFLPKFLTLNLIFNCFYRVLNINILIFITFIVMIIFNYQNLTFQDLFFYSKFIWTSLLSCIFIKNVLYMKINKQNLICLFIVLSLISLFSYIYLFILFSFICLNLDSIILKMNGKSSGSNNLNKNSNWNNNGPNNPKPNDPSFKLYSDNKSSNESKEKLWDCIGTNIKNKVELNNLNLESEKDFMYREEYYRELDKNSNINNNSILYKNNYGNSLIYLVYKVPKNTVTYMIELKLEVDSLSLDRDIVLINYKALINNEHNCQDKNSEIIKQLEKEKEANLSKYQALSKELAQKDKSLRRMFKLHKIP